MIPIQVLKDGQIAPVKKNKLYTDILGLCEEHQSEGRALAFGFLFFDERNPHIRKMLNDHDYWLALDSISGKYLSIFYIVQNSYVFGQDLIEAEDVERRGLFQLELEQIRPMLKHYFAVEEKIKLPTVMFFQVRNGMITDYFWVELFEEKIEESFIELKSYISTAIQGLKSIKVENFNNSTEIFNLLKADVEFQILKRKVSKGVQKFPVQLLIKWIIGRF